MSTQHEFFSLELTEASQTNRRRGSTDDFRDEVRADIGVMTQCNAFIIQLFSTSNYNFTLIQLA